MVHTGPSARARRAVAYLRLADPATAPQDQRRAVEAIEGWAARERVTIASWSVDVGLGGMTPIAERPGLVAAYRALVAERADVLVAERAACFSQDELIGWLIERAALTQGASVHAVDGSAIPTRAAVSRTPEEHESWTRGALELARAYDRVLFGARVRAALAERRARGQRIGNVPFGYRLAADGVHLERDPNEQTVVATVRRLAAEGLSQRAIAARLAERGVAGRTGAPLRQTQIGNILRSAS
jgi:DNA invertase Pin-like site-specific DNA recombinase